VIVNVWPAIVSVPVRTLPAVFAATLYVTVPIPVPLAPAVIVTQPTLLIAVHEQLVPVTTDRLPVFAVDGTEALVVPSV
jgi:hypothetical protein